MIRTGSLVRQGQFSYPKGGHTPRRRERHTFHGSIQRELRTRIVLSPQSGPGASVRRYHCARGNPHPQPLSRTTTPEAPCGEIDGGDMNTTTKKNSEDAGHPRPCALAGSTGHPLLRGNLITSGESGHHDVDAKTG